MLREPEAMIVRDWLMAGGIVSVIPFGMTGRAWSFFEKARVMGAWGQFKRHGALHVERAALPYVAAGLLSMAQARVAPAWTALHSHGPMCGNQLGRRLELHCEVARNIMAELVRLRAAEAVANARFFTVRATGTRAPHWTDFVPREQARAA